mmetsp:Transcript_116628/g.249368  ORF Transcript_116628/g.249368 Transcript_116628/m.249368 type:complete len:268 (+) Transcript_116628:70-873(+)
MTTLLLALCLGILAAASPGRDGDPGGALEEREAVAFPEVEEEWSDGEVLLLQLKHELTRQKVLSHSALAATPVVTVAPAAASAPLAGDLDAWQNLEEFGAMQVSFLQEHQELINASAKEQQVSNDTQVRLDSKPAPVDDGSESQSAEQKDDAVEKTREVLPQFAWPEWASILQAAHGRAQTIAERIAHRSTSKGATGVEAIGWVLLVGLAVVCWLILLVYFNWTSSRVPPEEGVAPAVSETQRRPTVRSFLPGGGGQRRPRTNTGCC